MTRAKEVSRTVSSQLLHGELELLRPAVRRDPARVSELLTADFFEIGASGRVWTRSEILDLLAKEVFSPPVIEDFACKHVAKDVVLVTYRAVRNDVETGQGSTTLRSSIWLKKAGKWRIRFHQGTKVGR
jgi:glyoxylase I family protein